MPYDGGESTRQYLARRERSLREDRADWLRDCQDLADYILPLRKPLLSDPKSTLNKRTRRGHRRLDPTATLAARTLAAGMMSGLTSPARPWFVLGLDDRDLAKWGRVKEWLDAVRLLLLDVFAKSNLYNMLHQFYEEQGVFGTASLLVDEDQRDVIRCYQIPVGEYAIANSSRMEVDTLYRTFALTVGQVVQRFGLENISDIVERSYERGDLSRPVEIVNAIEPNPRYTHAVDPQADWAKAFNGSMPYRSIYYECGSDDEDKLLAEAGYHEKPFQAARWTVHGNEVYGDGPGYDAISMVRQLQGLRKVYAKGAAKQAGPPVIAPESMRRASIDTRPDAVNFVENTKTDAFRPLYEVRIDLNAVSAEMRETQNFIRQTFFADLFLMISQMDRAQPSTAEEIRVRQEEKMQMLGPVVERNQGELLTPLIGRTLEICRRRGLLPMEPPELQGQPVAINYVSVLAQAQRSSSTVSIERMAAFVGNLAAARPDVLNKLNIPEIVDAYADALLVPPKIVVPTDEAAAASQAQAQQQQAVQQGAAGMAAVQGAKTLSETDVGGGQNALALMLSGLGGPQVAR